MSYHPYQSSPLVPSGVSFFGQANGQDQLHEATNNFAYNSGLDLLHVGNITINDDGRIGNASYPDLIELGSDGITTVNSGVVIQGDLTVNGTQFISNTETVVIADNILLLNSGVVGTPTESAGLEVQRGTECNVHFIWEEDKEKWMFTNGEKKVAEDGCGTLDSYNKFSNLKYHRIGVANNGLAYDAADSEYFSVAQGLGITVGTNVNVNVGHGIEIDNATNAVEAVAGTGVIVNADGIHVNLCADDGLAFNGSCFGIVDGSGLLTNNTGLHVGQGNGITVGADDISVKPHHGIVVGSLGVSVNPSLGIAVDANGVSVVDGSGILVDGVGVHVNTGDGLEIVSDKVKVVGGDAITVDAGGVNVDISKETATEEPENNDLLLLEKNDGTLRSITFEHLTDELQSIKTIETIDVDKASDYAYKDVTLINAGSSSVVTLLPPAISASGQVLTFKRIDAASDATYTVKIQASGTQTIDDAGFKRLYYRYEGINVISNGTNWFII